MAKIRPNSLFAELRGRLGDSFVIKMINGQAYVTQKAQSKRRRWMGTATGTPKQVLWRNQFHHATRFARAVKDDPPLLAYYLALAKAHGMRLRDICVSDYFSKPKIEAVDLSKYSGRPGGRIRFKAYETYPLGGVTVWITGQEGVCEKGLATGRGKTWTYTATLAMPPGKVKIDITARDHANQTATHQAEWTAK